MENLELEEDELYDKKRQTQDIKLTLKFGFSIIIVIAILVIGWVYILK